MQACGRAGVRARGRVGAHIYAYTQYECMYIYALLTLQIALVALKYFRR